MGEKEDLYKKYELVNKLIVDEVENLKYLLDNAPIEDINLLNIHYKIYDLILKRDNIKTQIFNEYDEIVIDEE